MIPGILEPGIFGWDRLLVEQMGFNEYGARVLAEISAAALGQFQNGNGRLVNYGQLPESIWPDLMEYWNVTFSEEQTRRMMAVARLNAKNPALPFEPDSQAKHALASAEIRTLTSQWLEATHRQLESRRLAAGFA
jgi:hypothetical protein